MDTKGPINPPSKQNSYIHVIVDAFSHFVVTIPILKMMLKTYSNSELATFYITMGIRHSPRTPYAPWTKKFLHVHFSDKLKPLRIGPFKIINKFFDITYEIVIQDGYTSHIHRNHLVPYYPRETIIFPFVQQYNPHSNDDNDNNDSIINNSIKSFDSFPYEEQSIEDEDNTFTHSNKETDIPFTIDFQSKSFNQYSPFPYQQIKQKANNTNSENQSDIHDYDNYINPRGHTYDRYNFRPQPRKDYRLFLFGEKDVPSFS